MSAKSTTVRVPGKINLQLSVGPLNKTGYHDIATVFQAVSIYDDITIRIAEPGSGITISIVGEHTEMVPTDSKNLAYQAAALICRDYGVKPDLAISLVKSIPVAGGMAGGSANAGAVLVGIDSLFSLGISRNEMEKIGASLGSDIPFTISGGTAIGTGRGEQITPALSRGTYYWVLALSSSGLSTPAVFQECDRLRDGLSVAHPVVNDQLMQALMRGDATALGKNLTNDLQAAALSLRPALKLILDVGMDYGALGGIVSGSGPTVAFLVESEERSLDLVVALTSSGVVGTIVQATGPVVGARVIEHH